MAWGAAGPRTTLTPRCRAAPPNGRLGNAPLPGGGPPHAPGPPARPPIRQNQASQPASQSDTIRASQSELANQSQPSGQQPGSQRSLSMSSSSTVSISDLRRCPFSKRRSSFSCGGAAGAAQQAQQEPGQQGRVVRQAWAASRCMNEAGKQASKPRRQASRCAPATRRRGRRRRGRGSDCARGAGSCPRGAGSGCRLRQVNWGTAARLATRAAVCGKGAARGAAGGRRECAARYPGRRPALCGARQKRRGANLEAGCACTPQRRAGAASRAGARSRNTLARRPGQGTQQAATGRTGRRPRWRPGWLSGGAAAGGGRRRTHGCGSWSWTARGSGSCWRSAPGGWGCGSCPPCVGAGAGGAGLGPHASCGARGRAMAWGRPACGPGTPPTSWGTRAGPRRQTSFGVDGGAGRIGDCRLRRPAASPTPGRLVKEGVEGAMRGLGAQRGSLRQHLRHVGRHGVPARQRASGAVPAAFSAARQLVAVVGRAQGPISPVKLLAAATTRGQP